MTCLESGKHEGLKGCWHIGGLIFASGAALYNAAAFVQRRESHLAINMALYSGLVAYELSKCVHHFEDRHAA